MIERRNFYRILYVQPDASMAVIRENYRVLMQKLKIHPDLGDSNWNENLLDMAYDTLRDPLKRAAYDHELLKRYHIKTLSQGGFCSNANFRVKNERNFRFTQQQNQRNYYRILQVQPDAPIMIIAASYQALKKSLPQDIALLDEAYQTLSNPVMREQYDVLLVANNFSYDAEESVSTAADSVSNISQSAMNAYQAVITHYCSFCKTPYLPQATVYQGESCLECASPLFVMPYEGLKPSYRTMMRMNLRGKLMLYLFWPGGPYQGLLQDLSPTGIRFLTEQSFDLHGIIKIDAPNLQAVIEVAHQRKEGKEISVGGRFITVKFDQQRGNFITAHA
ncbi:DnaJ domain-containing protein [Nitrosomonas sp. Nm166]|uniref:DnaJ domain-containing protein n=1 Tax=Nitrosomonas sp. Nm166 TaxID=1881054 RepID=UPI0008EAA3F0|nr:DnaJ domain-containing protein [Nitrosomonas sp. Nm166]SFD91183.1 DnaJ domain-containing protein [Nitrosomonas sp. Nm166]